MKVLLQSVAKKTDFVSMSLVKSNEHVFVGSYRNTSLSTIGKTLSDSNAIASYCGGDVFSIPNTVERSEILNINKKAILTYINMPFFPSKTTVAQKMKLYVTVDGVEHVFITENDDSNLGRLFSFNAPNNWLFYQKRLESTSNLYMQGMGLVCDTSLKIEFELVGYDDTDLSDWAAMLNNQKFFHVAYKEIGLNDEITGSGFEIPPQHVTPLSMFAQ